MVLQLPLRAVSRLFTGPASTEAAPSPVPGDDVAQPYEPDDSAELFFCSSCGAAYIDDAGCDYCPGAPLGREAPFDDELGEPCAPRQFTDGFRCVIGRPGTAGGSLGFSMISAIVSPSKRATPNRWGSLTSLSSTIAPLPDSS